MMIELRNWEARRSGGRITITGVDGNGRPRKIVNVDTIVAVVPEASMANAYPIATDRHGVKYVLIC
jgi:hypothetical protein